MSGIRPGDGPPSPPTYASAEPPQVRVPNAEKYVLEADAMRRRQLRSALLHGSGRTWREHRGVWVAVIVGLVVVAVVVAAIAVLGVVRAERAAELSRLSGVVTA
jgi:hypothetical protein